MNLEKDSELAMDSNGTIPSIENPPNVLDYPTAGTKARLGDRQQTTSPHSYEPGGSTIFSVDEEDAKALTQLSDSTTVRVQQNHQEEPLALPSSAVTTTAHHDLNLLHNDNSFHVVASLLCEQFEACRQDQSLVLDPEQRQAVTRIVPEPDKFLLAVRNRTEPADLLSRLKDLQLDDPDTNHNPLYLVLQHEDTTPTSTLTIPLRSVVADSTHAFLAGSFSSKSDTTGKIKTTDRQKLQIELEEAKEMLQNSTEPENQIFWKSHIERLQAQTRTIVPAEDAPTLDRNITEQMVDVVAPADLPGHYRFEAEIEGVRFIATVPPNGVQMGETFTCVMKELDSVAIDIPVGAWKDGTWGICSLGCCHPTAWHAIFCPLILLSQVQTRLDLDFLGRPRFGNASMSNRMLMWMVVSFWIMVDAVLFTACNLKWSQGLELTWADWCAVAILNLFMVGFVIFVTQSTRSFLREKYMIREERCFDLEDLCCAVTCLPCTVAQMARHTANYNTYEAVCCSKTGLPKGVKVDKDESVKDGGYAV